MKRIKTKSKSGIGIVLCDCGGTLAKRLDFNRLRDSLAVQDGVAVVKPCSGFCRVAEAARVIRKLAAKGCRRVVVAACRREIYESPLADAMSQARFLPGLAVDASIREQCAWVHPDRDQATAKALDLVAAAVRRAALAEAVTWSRRKILSNVVILGGGLSGMQAALRLSDLGHAVTLVTRGGELGGCAERLPEFFGYLDSNAAAASNLLKQAVASARERIRSDKRIRWIPRTACRSVSGAAGRFIVSLRNGDREQTLKAGAIVLAVGAFAEFPLPKAGNDRGGLPDPCRASACRGRPIQSGKDGAQQAAALQLGRVDAVLSLADLADALRENKSLPRSVALVVDVHGEQGRAAHALTLSAAERLAASRRRRVVLYCRHVRVAAWGMESLYRRVRDAGVLIFRYEKSPVFTTQERGVAIRALDPQSGAMLEELFEAVVMADARPVGQGDSLPLPRTLRRGPAGAFQADNVWLLSSKSNQPGIYVIGAARGNSELRDAQNDAGAAAMAIHQWMGAGQLLVASDTPVVDAEKCVLCLTCLRSCPHGAIVVDNKQEAAAISAVACQRCGLCATLCPARAIRLPRFSDDQLAAELASGPRVTVFACENSAWPAANAAGIGGREYGSEVRLIRVPCAGRVDERHVLGALESGAARVLVLGCHREACRYLVGADHAAKRVERLKAVLAKAGLDPAQVGVGHLTEFETGRFLDYLKG